MTWFNHKLLTGSLVFTSQEDIILTTAAVIGSVLPDSIEQFVNRFGRKRRNHRQMYHWFIPYLLLFLILYKGSMLLGIDRDESMLWNLTESPILAICLYYLSGIALGGFLHIIEDCLFGTVPAVLPSKRMGKLILKVGSLKEYIFVSSLCLLLWLQWLSKYRGE